MTARPIRKVLIANRGEIAVRIIRTCKEMGISTVSVFSDVDRSMPHVVMANEAYHIGPAPSRDSYLAMDKIIAVARRSGADAIHPGYGFLSENAEFADRVTKAGLIFVGPSPESIRAMGDKTKARKLVKSANVSVVPGTEDAAEDVAEVSAFVSRYGFPVLIKAAAGGGGRGMRIVQSMAELPQAFKSAQSEARSAFGDGRLYVEKYLEEPRHVEFQILADRFGNTIHLGERECSIQRRHQKLVEESPSPVLDGKLRELMGGVAVTVARVCNYTNAGTIEFLVDKLRNFYFLEMNTRLQVEHPVAEMRTGIDMVAMQLSIAMGEKLPFEQRQVPFRGHAIECRICAEDPRTDFMPSTGSIVHLKPAQGFMVRDDRGIEQGGVISVYYDSMISKLVVWGNTRAEAIQRMVRALHEYEILGIKTNIPLLLFVLQHPKFMEGTYDTHFIPTHFDPESLLAPSEHEVTAAAIICAMLEDEAAPAGAKADSTIWLAAGNTDKDGPSTHKRVNRWKMDRVKGMRM